MDGTAKPAEVALAQLKTAVRAIIGAAAEPAAQEAREAQRARHMREAATAADPSDMEMMTTCQNCAGVVYVNYASSYRLLADECPGPSPSGQGQRR